MNRNTSRSKHLLILAVPLCLVVGFSQTVLAQTPPQQEQKQARHTSDTSIRITSVYINSYHKKKFSYTLLMNTAKHDEVKYSIALSRVDGAQFTPVGLGEHGKEKSDHIPSGVLAYSPTTDALLTPGTYILNISMPDTTKSDHVLSFTVDQDGLVTAQAANTPVVDTFVDDQTPDPNDSSTLVTAATVGAKARRRHKKGDDSSNDPGPTFSLSASPYSQFTVEVWLDDELDTTEAPSLSVTLIKWSNGLGSSQVSATDIPGESLSGTWETTLPSAAKFYYLSGNLHRVTSSNKALTPGSYTIRVVRKGSSDKPRDANFVVKP